jgi:hypothetical protein
MAARTTRSMALVLAVLPAAAVAQDHRHVDLDSPYAGLQEREIKSLSEEDIE